MLDKKFSRYNEFEVKKTSSELMVNENGVVFQDFNLFLFKGIYTRKYIEQIV